MVAHVRLRPYHHQLCDSTPRNLLAKRMHSLQVPILALLASEPQLIFPRQPFGAVEDCSDYCSSARPAPHNQKLYPYSDIGPSDQSRRATVPGVSSAEFLRVHQEASQVVHEESHPLVVYLISPSALLRVSRSAWLLRQRSASRRAAQYSSPAQRSTWPHCGRPRCRKRLQT